MSEKKRTGVIRKALSGFYYVQCGEEMVTCRARGKFRYHKITPLVGDSVVFLQNADGSGFLDSIQPRRNAFIRPAIANIDQMVIVASGAIPVTTPFLIDRMISAVESKGCAPLICINKWDLVEAEDLYQMYKTAGFPVIRLSAETGLGMEDLRQALAGKISAFTGNSGVGKSSLLNALNPAFAIPVGEVSDKLGRGRHTTRHIELFPLAGGVLADTPGFSAFDLEQMNPPPLEELPRSFREFAPFVDGCQFLDCTHRKEKGCAVLQAVREGQIQKSRHDSYVKLYEQAKEASVRW